MKRSDLNYLIITFLFLSASASILFQDQFQQLDGQFAALLKFPLFSSQIDNVWDALLAWVRSVSIAIWAVLGGGALIALSLVIIILHLRSRMNKDEKELLKLEGYVEVDHPLRKDQEKTLKSSETVQRAENIFNADMPGTPQPIPQQPPSSQVSFSVVPGIPTLKIEKPVEKREYPELRTYIHQARASGLNDKFIAQELRKAGWRDVDIRNALGYNP